MRMFEMCVMASPRCSHQLFHHPAILPDDDGQAEDAVLGLHVAARRRARSARATKAAVLGDL